MDHQAENDAEPTAMSTPNELPPGDPPPTPCLGATSDDTTDDDSHLAVGIENGEIDCVFPLEDNFPEDDVFTENGFSFPNIIETQIADKDQFVVELPSSFEGTHQALVN
jgi:hypothetical protein